MKNYILYVPSTQGEFESLSYLSNSTGTTPNLVLWQDVFYETIGGRFTPSTTIVMRESSTKSDPVFEDPVIIPDVTKEVPEVSTDVPEQLDGLEVVNKTLEHHAKQIKAIASLFSDKLLPTDFYDDKIETIVSE